MLSKEHPDFVQGFVWGAYDGFDRGVNLLKEEKFSRLIAACRHVYPVSVIHFQAGYEEGFCHVYSSLRNAFLEGVKSTLSAYFSVSEVDADMRKVADMAMRERLKIRFQNRLRELRTPPARIRFPFAFRFRGRD